MLTTLHIFQTIYSIAPFPHPQLNELREKYTYNITPFTAAMATGKKLLYVQLKSDIQPRNIGRTCTISSHSNGAHRD